MTTATADLASVSFGAKGKFAYPNTLKVAPGGKMVFDLSALPKDAKVHRASLFCPGPQPRDPIRIYVIDKVDADDKVVYDDKSPLKLQGPYYRSFDVTDPVQRWAAKPESNLGLSAQSYSGQPTAAYLFVQYETKTKASNLPPQVEGLKVHHANGQTFLVWKEVPAYRPPADATLWVSRLLGPTNSELAEGPGPGLKGAPRHAAITLKTLRDLQGLAVRDKAVGEWARDMAPFVRLREVPEVKYRVYRLDKKITPETLKDAQLVGESAALCAYQDGFLQIDSHGEYYAPRENAGSVIPTYSVAEGKPVLPGEAYFVHTPDKPGQAYYAVTTVQDGVENLQQLSAANVTAEALDEKPDDPQPVPQWVTFNKTRYGQIDATEHWFAYWLAAPFANVPDNTPRRIVVAVPDKFVEPGPLILNTNAGMGPGWKVDKTDSIHLHIEQDVAYAGDLCYHQGKGTLRGFSQGVVDYFSDRYVTKTIKWTLGKWKIDAARVTSSIGTHYALRHPDILPVLWTGPYEVDYDQKWNPAFGSLAGRLGPMDAKTIDGAKAWDAFDASWRLRNHVDKDIPFFIHDVNGKEGGHAVEFGWQDDAKGLCALRDTRQPHVAHWGGASFSGDIRKGLANMKWTKSVPAFSNCSLDANIGNGDPADGDPWGTINGFLFWVYDDIVEEADRWEMTVYVTPDCFADACSVDLTPRHCTKFKPKEGREFTWSNKSLADDKALGSGEVAADKYGLVTLKKLTVNKGKNRLVIEKK